MAWAVLISFLLLSVATAAETISAFEQLDKAAVMRVMGLGRNKTAITGSDVLSDSQEGTLSFQAFGRLWDWDISPNHQLLASLPRQQQKKMLSQVSLWKGRSPDDPKSWIRFSVWTHPETGQTQWRGLWWDGAEFYRIAPAHATALAAHFDKLDQNDAIIAFRLSDVVPDTPLACGVNDADDFSYQNDSRYQPFFSELENRWKSAQDIQVASSQLNVAIVADTFYQSHWGSNSTASILDLMNNVDGIYSDQIGVTLNVSQLLLLNDNGPMTATDSGVLLPQFRDWVGAGNLTNPGLAHLFTSRNLDGNIKGRAYVNVLCAGQWGTGIDEIVGNSYETIIVAHEMGHNFGADHDGDAAGACPNEPPNTYIMSPTVSASYTDFSTCSQNILINNAGVAACISPLDNDLIFAHGFE